MDGTLDVDWAAHWRSLVEAREAQIGPAGNDDWWGGCRARRFAFSMRGQPDWFLGFLEPWLRPTGTLIDVGAGTGRHAAPLAERLDWVTAVEPSHAMRERIPPAENMTVIGSTWRDGARTWAWAGTRSRAARGWRSASSPRRTARCGTRAETWSRGCCTGSRR